MLEARLGRPLTSFSLAGSRALVWIVLVGVCLRVASALFQGNAVTDLPGVYDQISYDELARRVVDGYGFTFATGHWPATRAGEPTAHWSYLYTLYLSAVYAVAGFQPLIARLIQAVIAGIVHPWLAWRIGRSVFGPRVGLLAALFSTVYVYFFYYAGALVTETFYILGVLWTLDVSVRLARGTRRPSPGLWLELGFAIGVTLLLRQVFVVFVPVLFAWLVWNIPMKNTATAASRSITRALRLTLLVGLAEASLVVVLLIAPWTVRNALDFGIFVPLNTNAGYAFYWANHPIQGTDFVPLLPLKYDELIPAELLPLNEAELDRALLGRGLGFVVDDPGRCVLLSLSRVKEYFKFWPSSQSGLVSNVSRVGSFGLFLPLIVYGVWVSMKLVRSTSNSNQRSGIVLLFLFSCVYTMIHLLSWALIRYRLPVDSVLLLFAALGLAPIADPLLQRIPGFGR